MRDPRCPESCVSQPPSVPSPCSTPVIALPGGLARALGSLLVLWRGGNARMSALGKTRACKSVRCRHPGCTRRGLRRPGALPLPQPRPAASATAQKRGAPVRVYEQNLDGPPPSDTTPQACADGQGHRGRPATLGLGGPGCHGSPQWCKWGSPTRSLYKTILSQPLKIRHLSKTQLSYFKP